MSTKSAAASIESTRKRGSPSTHGASPHRKKLKRNTSETKGVGSRTRSRFVSIKSRLRNANDCTHKIRYEFVGSELQSARRRRIVPASQSLSQDNDSGNLTAELVPGEPVCSQTDLSCSKTLLRSFALVATEFVLFLDAQNVHFQNAQPSVRLCALSEDKYRKQKGDKLKYIKDALFSTENPDYHPMETSFTGAIFFFLENMLRPDPFNVEYTRLVGQSLWESSPTRTYLLLVEKKLDTIRSASSLPSTTTFDVFGLGDWERVQALLTRLFHLPLATTPSVVTAGEKSEPAVRSARHSVGSNHELKSQAAAEKSEDYMTGTRILSVWCDYVRTVGKLMHQHRDQPVVPTVDAIISTVRDMVLFTAQVRASESALAFDLGSVQMQRDIRNAVGKLDELVAELSVILIRYCSVPVASIVQAPARNILLSSSSHTTSATNSMSLQATAEQRVKSLVSALRALQTSWGDSRQTEAMCRFRGAQLVDILENCATNWQILRNNSTAPVPVIVTSKQLASVVGSLLRKMKLQLVKMAPVALKRETRAVPPTAFSSILSSTSSTTSSSSAAPLLTTSTQPTGVNALIARVDDMLAELPPEKSEVDRLLHISDININA